MIGWLVDTAVAFSEAKKESNYIKTITSNKDLERINSDELYKSLTQNGLKPLEIENLVLLPGEDCYYIDEVLIVGNLSENETKVNFYITNKRVVFNFIESLIDKDINEITYIGDVDMFNRVICIQFGKVGYNIKSRNIDMIKAVLKEVIKINKQDTGTIECTYCGKETNDKNKKCSNCGAPIRK